MQERLEKLEERVSTIEQGNAKRDAQSEVMREELARLQKNTHELRDTLQAALLTIHTLKDLPQRVQELAASASQLKGGLVVISVMIPLATALVLKYMIK